MKTNLIKRLLPLAFALGLAGNAVGQDLILVSGTDFTAKGMEDETFTSWEVVEAGGAGFLGIIKPQLTINKSVVSTTEFDDSSSDFVDGDFYCITNNPCKVDSFRFYDTKEAAWGILLPKCKDNETLMSLKVNGLKGASDYRVEIDYCFVADYSVKWGCGYPGASYNTGSKQVEFGSLDPKIRFVVNPDQYNTKSGPDMGFATTVKNSHGCTTATITPKTSNCGAVSSTGELQLNINSTQQTSAMFITGIRVYADITPKISGVENVCAGGEKGILSVGAAYTGATYQWYRDGAAINGETGLTCAHTSNLKETGKHTYYYVMTVDGGDGKKVERKSPVWTVNDIMCCQNDDGTPASRKLIYVNDFGTYSNDGGTITIWDFSDLSNPITKDIDLSQDKDFKPFNTRLPKLGIKAPEGAEEGTCMEDNGHSVVGWISDADGSKIGWAAQVGGTNEYWGPGRKNGPFFPDHTDQLVEQSVAGKTLGGHGKYGAALFVNAAIGDHSANGIRVYKQEIQGICEQTHLTVKCYINNYSDGKNPVDIQIRAYDSEHIGDPNYGGESERIVRYADGRDGYAWKEVSVDIPRIESKNLTFEILNYTANTDGKGDDLILDDIMVYACSSPGVDLYFDLGNYAKDSVSCEGEDIDLYVDETAMLKNYYGSDLVYLYQYTTSDADPTTMEYKKSWKNLNSSPISLAKNHEKIEDVIEEIKSKITDPAKYPTIKFRVVAGIKDMLEKEIAGANYFNPDDPCSNMSISKPIVLTIDCPNCTAPLDIKIKSDVTPKNKKIYLCKGESVNLTTNDIIPGESTWASKTFDGYTISWTDNGKATGKTKIGTKESCSANPLELTNEGVDAIEEHLIIVDAVDTEYPTLKLCETADTITVVYLPQPEIEDVPLEYCFGAPEADDVLPTAKAGEVINYYESLADAEAGTPSVEEPALATLEAKDVPYEYYYTLTSEYGCVSEPAKVSITVNAIPEYVVDPIDPFCAKQSKIDALPIADDAAKYSIAWTPAATAASLNTLEGSTTPYALTYVVTDAATGCVAKAQDYSVTVMPATTVKLTADSTCGKTTVSVLSTPTGATLTYFKEDGPAEEKTVFKPGEDVKEWKVVAEAEGYCPSADSIAVTVQKIPGNVNTADPSCYLKSQEATFTNVQTHCADKGTVAATYDAADVDNTGAGLVWRIAGTTEWSSTIPTPTVKNPKEAAEETIDYEVRLVNPVTGCYGETATFTAHIYGAPVPDVTNAEYCQGATADALSSRVTINNTIEGSYTLKVYTDKEKKNEVDMSTLPSTKTPGVVTYYATQTGVGGESDPVPFTVTTYGVGTPTVAQTDYLLCRDKDLAELSATLNVNPTLYMMGSTLLWNSEDGAFSETKPTVSNAKAGDYKFSVKQTYNIITTGFETVCEGEPVNINVTVDETLDPTGTFSVLYLYNDLETKGYFENLLAQDATVVNVEDGYKYEYAAADAAGNVTSAWSTEVPQPAAVDRSELVDEPKLVYYKVRRSKTTGGKCLSEEKLITVTITDSPTPAVTPAYFCEGETIPALDAYAKTTGTTKIPATGYTLLWYGSTKPAATEMESGSETAPASQTAKVGADGKTTMYTYYVAQRENESKAIGSPIALNITVYPKPVQTIGNILPVCETAVDMSQAVSFETEASGASYVTKYYSDAAGTTEITKSVTESGTYYAQTSFLTPNASLDPSVCASTVDPIKVTIETLELTKVVDAETCPNTAGLLHAEIKTNVDAATFSWQAAVGTDAMIDANNESGSSDFNTTKLIGKAGDKFSYNLVVTAGTCTESQNNIVVTLGDGPVVGTLTLTEEDNTNSGKVYTSTRDVTADPFYMCGSGVSAAVDLTKDANSEFSWTNAAGSVVGTGASATINAPGVYTINYSNNCATSMTFEVKDASIKNNAALFASENLKAVENEKLVICEGAPMEMTLTYTAGNDASTVAWTKDAVATTIVSGKSTSIAKSTPEMSGVYEYTITNYGCSATGSVEAKVKPFIKFAPAATQYIARRDSQLKIPTIITVPAVGAPSSISWTNKAGTEVNATKDFLYTVTASDKFTITMSDDDYCDATATVEVIKDARLQLETSIDEKMCRGDKEVFLVVDTTGTGEFYYKNLVEIVVTETIGEASHTISGLHAVDGKLKLEVHPTADATYTTKFIYREGEGVDEQMLVSNASIIVLQPIQIKVPTGLSVCAGDELEISLLSVTPEGSVVVNWVDDPTIQGSGTDTETITVVPEYDEEEGKNHNYKKVYNLVASMEGCADKSEKVTITVNEPITGTLSDTTICEGTSLRLDASNFKAATYEWTTPLVGNPVGNSQTAFVTPEATSTYTVAMTRGNCKAEAEMTVNVNSNPRITSVDSLDCRKVLINIDESYGTSPFYFAVDDTSYNISPEKDDLAYTVHVAKVKDGVGCMAVFPFNVKKPNIDFPIWFSPNGDGHSEFWSPVNIQKTYPEAEIKIFDRWGKMLVEFKGADDGWDGTYNGNAQPTTDYWYEVTIHEIDKVFTGHFTLMRR